MLGHLLLLGSPWSEISLEVLEWSICRAAQPLSQLKFWFAKKLKMNLHIAPTDISFCKLYTLKKSITTTQEKKEITSYISLCQTFTYGMQSCKYQCIKDWNRFKKENSTENLMYPVVKNIFKKSVLASY